MEQAARVALLSLALLGGLSVSRAEDAASSYSLAFGPAVEITPSYPGARSQRTFALPDIEAQYHDWLYISGTDLLGVYAYNHDNTQAGAAIEWDFTERLAKDSALLSHLGDVSTTPRFKLFFEPRLAAWLSGGVEAATDIGGHDEGTVAQAHVELLLPLTARGFVSLGPGVSWSDRRYMRAFFAVSAAQSALSGLPEYQAHAGVSDVYAEAIAGYQLSRRWALGLDVTVAHLQNDAAHSPFTAARAQTTWLGSLLYTFR
jgi:outer membrane protein